MTSYEQPDLFPGEESSPGVSPARISRVAGRRAGLAGARSGLFWQIMRLADELPPRGSFLRTSPVYCRRLPLPG